MGKISEIEKRTDHLGNVFSSEKGMCKKWNVHIATYRNRIKRGLSREEALTGNIKRSKEDIERCTDHKGNIFETEAAMCRQWNVLQSIYFDRIKRGLSREEALTGNIKRSKEDIERCTDHESNVFNSVTAMCRHWNVDFCTYKQRRNKRWSKEEALTGVRKYSDEELERRTDHEGNIFETESDMCEYWKLPLTSYSGRLKLGWSKEEALTGIKNRSQEDVERCTDHEGNIFSSERAMCRQWNINLGCYRSRIKKGLTKEEALTGIRNRSQEDIKRCTDHEGNVFETEAAMCRHWNLKQNIYCKRIKKGLSKKEALTGNMNRPPEDIERCTDHEGNIFDSEAAMCEHWKSPFSTYNSRLRLGWSKKEALTGIRNRSQEDIEKCTDHEGNIFNSEAAMCKYWDVPTSTYLNRIKRGCSKKEALTLTSSVERCTDHKGNVFETVIEMCKYWNVAYDTYKNRIRNGWSKKEALTGIRKRSQEDIERCTDHEGNVYPSVIFMCKHWNIESYIYINRIKRGWSKEEALTIPKNMYRGEKRIIDALEKRNISYLNDVSLQKALKFLNLEIDYNAFIEEFRKILKEEMDLDWSVSKIKRIRPDFILYKENDKITGIIEHDGEQHQCYVEFFFKTIEKFLERNEADYVKNNLWEYLKIPMLRTRDDQIDLIDEMVDDFLAHPENYITKHNTYLTEEEYWAPLIENYGDLDIAFSF